MFRREEKPIAALTMIKHAMAQADEIGDVDMQITGMMEQSVCYLWLEQEARAREIQYGAVALAESLDDPIRAAQARINLADFLRARHEADEARTVLTAALADAKAAQAPRALADIHDAYVRHAHEDDDEPAVIKHLQIMLSFDRQAGRTDRHRDVLLHIVDLYVDADNLDGAEATLRQLLSFDEQQADAENVCRDYHALAIILDDAGQIDRANEASRQGLARALQLEIPEHVAWAAVSLVECEPLASDPAEAAALLQRHYQYLADAPASGGVASYHRKLGELLNETGDPSTAEPLLLTAIDMHKQLGAVDLSAACARHLMVVYFKLDRIDEQYEIRSQLDEYIEGMQQRGMPYGPEFARLLATDAHEAGDTRGTGYWATRTVALAKDQDQPESMTYGLYYLAESKLTELKYGEALRLALRALDAAQRVEDQSEMDEVLARTAFVAGRCRFHAHKYKEASAVLRLAGTYADKLPDMPELKSRILGEHALCQLMGGDRDLAAKRLDEAWNAMSEQPSNLAEAVSLAVRAGHIYGRRRQFHQSLYWGRKAEARLEELNNPTTSFDVRQILMQCSAQLNESDDAIKYGRLAMAHARNGEDPRAKLAVGMMLASQLDRTQQYDDAQRLYREILQWARQLKLDKTIADMHNNIGFIEVRRGNTDAAAESLNQALKIYQRLQNQQDVIRVMTNLAMNAQQAGEYEAAKAYLHKTHEMWVKLNNMERAKSVLKRIEMIEELQADEAEPVDAE